LEEVNDDEDDDDEDDEDDEDDDEDLDEEDALDLEDDLAKKSSNHASTLSTFAAICFASCCLIVHVLN